MSTVATPNETVNATGQAVNIQRTEDRCIENYGSVDDTPAGAMLCYLQQENHELRQLLERGGQPLLAKSEIDDLQYAWDRLHERQEGEACRVLGKVISRAEIAVNVAKNLERVPPALNAMFETKDGNITGTTVAPISRVELQDDWSFTVVINHWPAHESADENLRKLIRFVFSIRDAMAMTPGFELDAFPSDAQRSQLVDFIKNIVGLIPLFQSQIESAYRQGKDSGGASTAGLSCQLDPLEPIRSIVREYYRALDYSQHCGLAQVKAFSRIQEALGFSWVPGANKDSWQFVA